MRRAGLSASTELLVLTHGIVVATTLFAACVMFAARATTTKHLASNERNLHITNITVVRNLLKHVST